VGVDGAVVCSCGGQVGSQMTQMNVPRGLAVDKEGRVLVSDRYNNRLLVIDEEEHCPVLLRCLYVLTEV